MVCVTDGYASHLSYLARIDLKGWTQGEPVPRLSTPPTTVPVPSSAPKCCARA